MILACLQGGGLGKWLMLSMYDIVVHKGLERLLGGGRMPGYHKKAEEMTADQYLQAVVKGELKDPVITFLLRCGRTPVKVAANYLADEESCNYGALNVLEFDLWKEPLEDPGTRVLVAVHEGNVVDFALSAKQDLTSADF